MKRRVYYLHTLNGRPAFFDGEAVYLMPFYGKPGALATSLRQIRREQQASRRFVSANFPPDTHAYDYVRVVLPEGA